MSLIAKENGGAKREPISAGVKTAVCCGVIDLGEQENVWKDHVKTAHKVMFMWEIPAEIIETEDGPVPRTISKQYTASLHERAGLRKMLQSWRGKPFTQEETEGFDLKSMLNAGCLLGIVHTTGQDGNTYANVDSVIGLPDGMEAPKASRMFSYDMDAPDALDALSLLPEWIQDRVKKGNTYQALVNKRDRPDWKPEDALAPMDGDEDLPF